VLLNRERVLSHCWPGRLSEASGQPVSRRESPRQGNRSERSNAQAVAALLDTIRTKRELSKETEAELHALWKEQVGTK